jgi:hypothetical protein
MNLTYSFIFKFFEYKLIRTNFNPDQEPLDKYAFNVVSNYIYNYVDNEIDTN